ncbi:hypothetical protein F5Y07DRAFT_365443 [Xylaria sp. FL0933]|nr:hypothetical protein F5Y07DRAFT_365443 [Xylaria sp. FL0933]
MDNKYYARANRIWKANLAFLRSLPMHDGNYVHPEDFERLNIVCSTLDLQSGKSSDGSDCFLTPFPKSELHTLLNEKLPSTMDQLDDEPDDFNERAAMEVMYLIRDYVSDAEDDEHYAGIMYEETTWNLREMQWDEGERLLMQEDGHNWRVGGIFDKMDNHTPHVSPLLADSPPMQEDKLSLAEICCILLCTARRLRRKEYRRHRIIPVTVISLSGRLARIVHGYVDVLAGKLRVSKSPILNLYKEDYRPEIEVLVSWCLGQPTGSTAWVDLD